MADFTNARINDRSVYPVGAISGQQTTRTEAMLTPEMLVSRFLKGIPLISATIDPVTKRAARFDDPEYLKDCIVRAVVSFEDTTGITVIETEFSDSVPFDRSEYNNFLYIKSTRKPILAVTNLSINPGNDQQLYIIPPMWISNSYFAMGQVNLTALLSSVGNTFVQPAGGPASTGALFLGVLSQLAWVPSFWTMNYVAGFRGGQVPVGINEVLGSIAAIEILGQLGATNRNTGNSLGADGMSQSVSSPGPNVYATRIKDLSDKKDKMIKKIKSVYNKKFVLGTL